MINILNNCNRIQKTIECCHDDGRMCNCSECLREGFYQGADTYSCLKKLCFYVMNYGPAYVSEIYHFLGASKILEKNFPKDLNVLSLGCGFGPDYIALNKYMSDNSLNLKLKYWGYDIEKRWLNINKGIATNLPHIKNLLDGFSLGGFHVIFLNKVFSTLLKSNSEQKFLDLFVNQIITHMPIGSVIIYNDINHYQMGRDQFDYRVSKVTNIEGKYYFNVQSAHCADYIEIPRIDNICQVPMDLPISHKNSVSKSVFFAYKKMKAQL